MSTEQMLSHPPKAPTPIEDDGDVVEEDNSSSAIWTAEERTILNKHIAGYRNATRNQKAPFIVQTVIPEIKARWKGRYSSKNMAKDRVAKGEWARKKKVRSHSAQSCYTVNVHLQQIFNWFPNHASTARKMKIPGFNCKVTFDSVVLYHKKKEIEELAISMAGEGAAENNRKWFPFFQTAKKQIKNELSDEETDEYMQEVSEWEKNGVPLDVQKL